MKIARITPIGKRKVYDISVKDAEHYVLENGVITHNTGLYYSADTIWIIGRQQDKDAKEGLKGWDFIINIEKSRFVKEKSKIPITVSFKKGVNRYSGMFELALEFGYIMNVSKGKYSLVDQKTGEVYPETYKEADLVDNASVWNAILETTDFKKEIHQKYALGASDNLMSEDDMEELLEEKEE